MKKTITILGGGIAGLSTAIALKNAGIETMVFEAAPEIKPVGAGLGLGANAIKAFKILGIDKEVMNARKPGAQRGSLELCHWLIIKFIGLPV